MIFMLYSMYCIKVDKKVFCVLFYLSIYTFLLHDHTMIACMYCLDVITLKQI